MDENLNQKISCFMDDELKRDDALKVLKEIQLQPELRHKFDRYQRVSYALNAKKNYPLNDNFLEAVQQGISNEPLYFSATSKPSPKKTYASYLALAASVALIALLVSKFINHALLEANTISPPVMAAISKTTKIDTQISTKQVSSQDTRFNDYLQAHNTRFYTQGSVEFQPYVQTVSYRQD